jgi:hypothetical protein
MWSGCVVRYRACRGADRRASDRGRERNKDHAVSSRDSVDKRVNRVKEESAARRRLGSRMEVNRVGASGVAGFVAGDSQVYATVIPRAERVEI